jgi:hypothetical protein
VKYTGTPKSNSGATCWDTIQIEPLHPICNLLPDRCPKLLVASQKFRLLLFSKVPFLDRKFTLPVYLLPGSPNSKTSEGKLFVISIVYRQFVLLPDFCYGDWRSLQNPRPNGNLVELAYRLPLGHIVSITAGSMKICLFFVDVIKRIKLAVIALSIYLDSGIRSIISTESFFSIGTTTW